MTSTPRFAGHSDSAEPEGPARSLTMYGTIELVESRARSPRSRLRGLLRKAQEPQSVFLKKCAPCVRLRQVLLARSTAPVAQKRRDPARVEHAGGAHLKLTNDE